MRDLKDWHKQVELDEKAALKTLEKTRAATLESRAVPIGNHHKDLDQPRANGHSVPSESRLTSTRSTPPLARKGRGPRKEETREELLSRLLDPTLTLDETARMLEVCPTTVRRYTNKGILPHDRSKGNQRRFKLSSVLAFMESQAKNELRDIQE